MRIRDTIENKEKEKAKEGYIPYIEIGDIDLETKHYSLKEKSAVPGAVMACKGDILVSTVRPTRGAITTVQEDKPAVSSAFAILRPNLDLCNPKFLFYCVCSKPFLQYLGANSKGAAYPTCSKDDVLNYDFKMVSVKEQSNVVQKLDRLSNIIIKRKRQISLLDDLIKARFVEMFGNIKDTCEVGYYIISLTAGKSLAGETECENKVLKTGAASFDFFDATQVKNLPLDYEPQAEHLVKPGDIIISRMNTAELTGAAAYVWDVKDNVYLPDRLWKANLKEECNPIFVWQMLIQPSTKEQIRRKCSGTSGSMKNISKPGMLAIKVKMVPVELQNQFAEFVKQIDKSKFAVQKSLEKTQLLFDSLMQKYFG